MVFNSTRILYKSIEVLRNKSHILLFLVGLSILSSCATQKKRSELSWLAKRYHNMTAKFNGYYNADVIMDESFAALDLSHEDNYNRVLPVYTYSAGESADNVRQELDLAIEKVTKVSRLHESSKWVDDCYVLMGKAQYLQGNYEAAEETFEYFVNNFNPRDPDSRIYKEKETSSKSKTRKRQKAAQEARKERLKDRKEQEKERNKEIKEREKERKETRKEREQARKEREKNRSNKSVSKKRKDQIREREKAAEASNKDDKSAEELRKQRIKDREQQIKDRKRSSKSKTDRKYKTRAERDAARAAEEARIEQEAKAAEEAENKSTEIETPQTEVEKEVVKPEVKEEEEPKKEVETDEDEEQGGKKSKKKNKSEELQDPAKGGFLKHEPAYYEGMLWLAKTYIARENYVSAKYYLDRIEDEEGVPAKVINEVPAVRSDLYIKQKKYDEAIQPLRQSIESSKDRALKARYAYILAQIHQLNGSPADAAEAFAQVEKFSRKYEMSLNAQLNQVKNSWAGGRTSYDGAIKELNRMERDKKNIDHVGAIYFTRAEIKLADGDEPGAIEDFELALSSSISSINKIESYYRLATLYFGLEDYLNAKNYFDSTASIMSKKDDRYTEVNRNKDNLREITKNILIIEEQDSLMNLGSMSEAELIAYAENILQAREKAQAEAEKISASAPPPAQTTGGTSKFFAYNNRSVQKGKSEFDKRWGRRPLEDDWRRSNKQSSIIVEEEVQTLEELDDDRQEEIEKILRDIPRNKKDKMATVAKVEQAYFDLGIAYRNYIKNYRKSSESLVAYLDRFPDGKNKLDAYYYMYLNAKDNGDNAEEQKYFELITRQYPKSDYAKVLKDPSYALELLTEEKKVQKAYDEAFSYFDKADFQTAYTLIRKAKEENGTKHDLAARYDLLEAMCIGNIRGKDDYVQALKTVVIKHINTPEQTRAREMLRFLRGDAEAFDGEVSVEELQEFVQEDDKLHYIIVSLFEADGNLVNDAKVSINTYNQTKHKDKRIRSTSIFLNQETKTHLILLRRFENKKVAMDYMKIISEESEEFLPPSGFSYEIFAVNQKNYREIVKQKSIRSYRLFFETYYLTQN